MDNKLKYKKLQDLKEAKGKKVLLRLDLNVPIRNGLIVDDFRIRQSMDTIDYLKKLGAKIIVLAHLENKENKSLELVVRHAQQFFQSVFVADPWSPEGEMVLSNLTEGQIAIIENIRNWSGEKENDQYFAKQLASLGDIYVNEAFSVSHREHASIVGVPKYLPSYAGLNFDKEVNNLKKAFNPPHPYLFILGGAKFETKAPLIKKFLNIADYVFVGGALANDLLKAKGFEVGKSVCSVEDYGFKEMLANEKLEIPMDVWVENEKGEKVLKKIQDVLPEEKIWDNGEATISGLIPIIKEAKFILWNGPLGVFETGYTQGTYALAKALADTNAETIVGGGDTLASIEALHIADKFTFISTAGGAMLDFLVNETLPGMESLKK